jgi:glycosyltransferase involved in cell wall biosynthesis
MSTLFSVIIITRNRVGIIGNVLNTIRTLDFPHDKFELIIVDNGSTDGTSDKVREVMQNSNVSLKIIHEPVAGMCRARNTGIAAATGLWIAFLDDDALVPANWLTAYHYAINAFPDAAAFGGPATLDQNLTRPWWWCSKFDVSMSCQDYGDQIMPYSKYTHPYGLNMVFDRHKLVEYNGFYTALDKLVPGLADETDLFFRLIRDNRLLVYVPAARVVHSVLPDRLYWSAFSKRCVHIGRTFVCLEARHKIRLHRSLARRLASAMLDFIRYPTPVVFLKECLEWYGYASFDKRLLSQIETVTDVSDRSIT